MLTTSILKYEDTINVFSHCVQMNEYAAQRLYKITHKNWEWELQEKDFKKSED